MDIIAEVGQAHEGSLGIAHSYIDALADAGITAIKWQTHIGDAESSALEPFRVKFSYEDKRRIDYWKRMEFTTNQWKGLKDHSEELGVEFISSPFSLVAVDLLEKIGVGRYKIGSGEVNNHLLLDKLSKIGKPVILSSGMSSFDELDQSVNLLKRKKVEVSIMQCTTSYPTYPEQWGLNVINLLKERYGIKVGFSDHSGDIFAGLAATTMGAEMLEFHVVFDKRMFGPDSKASLTIDQVSQLTKGIKQIQKALSNPIDKESNQQFTNLKNIFEKSLAVNRNMKKGEIIHKDDLETKKPKGIGISASQYQSVIGKQLVKDIQKWGFLSKDFIDE